MKTFEILHKDKNTKARIGELSTKKGKVKTPFFMPVATKGAVKYINTQKIEEMGAKAVISNALILHLRPGSKLINKMGGLGKFMNTNLINFTDSGGFQMYSDSIYIKSDDKGVHFKNPINGEKLFITPEKDMEIQLDIGSEVAMCLDRMPLYEDSKSEIEESVRLTTLWAKQCKVHHDKLQKKLDSDKKQLLFGITQGGIYKELREKSINELLKMDFDGYSIGGLGMGETKEEEDRIVELQKEMIPEEKPIYLMGIGGPLEIVDAVAKGVDIFDSRFPTQNARRGTLFTSKGNIKLLNKKYEKDSSPIDSNCKCFVCKNYTKAYVRFLLKEEEPVGRELASYHNLYYLQELMREIHIAIEKGIFSKLQEKIKRIYSKN